MEYGFHARFLVNYDMTFLYFLLQSGEQKPCERCFCPARIFCKKNCLPNDAAMRYAADMSVLLSYWKLCDAEQDESVFKRLGARSAKLLYRSTYRKAAERRPEENAVFSEQLAVLRRLEQANCASVDRASDAFAHMLCVCVACVQEETHRRAMEQLLYHVGRFLYLTDALEDLPKDVRTGNYNPLRYRYELTDGALSKTDREQFLQTVEASIDMAASALELLCVSAEEELLNNIIYYGLPAVLKSVADGTFRKRGKRNERPL